MYCQQQQQTGISPHDPITVDSTTTDDDQHSQFGDYLLNAQHSFDTFSDYAGTFASSGALALSPTIIREPVGDISPIKVSYGRTQALFEEASVIPDDWKQSEQSSDPVRVLDGAKEAFEGFKYVLRSVQTASSKHSVRADCWSTPNSFSLILYYTGFTGNLV